MAITRLGTQLSTPFTGPLNTEGNPPYFHAYCISTVMLHGDVMDCFVCWKPTTDSGLSVIPGNIIMNAYRYVVS